MGSEPIVMDERDFVLEVVCHERDGQVVRHVSPTRLDLEKMQFLWEKLREFDVLFNDHVRDDFGAFVNHFIVQVNGEYQAAGLMWDVDDVGMFLLNDIKPAISASAHFVFWDRKFSGREELCREMVKYAIEEFQLKRVQVEVPLYARKTLAAVERIGFVQEGRMRAMTLYKGDWFDSNVYSMIPEDFNEVHRQKDRRLVCWDCGEEHKQRYNPKREAR
jgi:RimJ/RimL family protein N-acetyltransferase